MTKISYASFSLLLSLVSTYLIIVSHAENPKDGFTLELIHRDSPKSPFYNPNITLAERFAAAVNRSLTRSRRFSRHGRLLTVDADLTSSGTTDYLMKIGMGTPPVEVLGFSDTGSSLIWTQGQPCTKCQDQPNPLFDPKGSSSYKNIGCSWTQCKVLSSISSCGGGDACMYKQTYLDGTYSIGNLATETLTIGSHALLSAVVGVGHDNGPDVRGSGIIGLDYGDASLISQLGPVINGIFSFCLTPFDSDRPSRIKFGSEGVVSGPSAVSTPITRKSKSSAYFLTLEAISVAGTRLAFPGSAYGGANEGNMMIDSGTTLTVLPMSFYNQVVAELDKVLKVEKAPVGETGFSLCYKTPGNDVLPEIQMHFKGADLKLSPSNSFPRISPETVCFSFIGSPAGVSIYGNMGQTDFLVGYDRNAATVSFIQQECS
ncbi:PREDICTED: aspartic proteinase CDR1-like [Tarenaya hassleriana]|uniref:aspartic proteinase CDR1-like n=1 Tax=Tarenaya hassleriana TaxID=28532 RepID=UPI00053C3787|nr:PREDICTED: aspartic proteinase CDR1-like [Tarenaya hassleriana]